LAIAQEPIRANWSAHTLDAVEVARLLGRTVDGSAPLYRDVADGLAALIDRGELPASARLPPERALADALRVSRTTVVSAYRLLRTRGRIASRRGSGSWVAGHAARPPAAFGRVAPAPGIRSLLGVAPDVVDLATATLGAEGVLDDGVVEHGTRELRRALSAPGYDARGVPALREAIAERLTRRGTPTGPTQILVTGGGQQALTLVAKLLLEPGSYAAVEDPTYAGALDVFGAAGARFVALPTGSEASPAGDLQPLLGSRDVRLAYVAPTHHNPTGAVLPEPRRRELAALAAERALPVIEDDVLGELAFEGEPPPALAAFDSAGYVLQVGSLSKSCWPGLRIGWIRAAPELVERLVRVKAVDDLATSVPSQALAVAVLADFERIVGLRRSQLRERLALLTELLEARLPEWRPAHPRGGASLWVQIPGAQAEPFSELALRFGVSILPGPLLSPTRTFSDHVRLQLLQPLADLEEGVARLARAWSAYARRDPATVRELRVVV
jgi:DNA-binding transcriptional MocR family regulator